MDNITQEIRSDIITNRVNLLRATVNEAAELGNLLTEQMANGHSKIVVDLSQCTHLDSTFIGVLVVTQKKLLAKSGKLKIVNPLDPASELFYLTGISKVFDVFENAEEAQKSFNNGIVPPQPKPEESDEIIPKQKVEWAFA